MLSYEMNTNNFTFPGCVTLKFHLLIFFTKKHKLFPFFWLKFMILYEEDKRKIKKRILEDEEGNLSWIHVVKFDVKFELWNLDENFL